MMEDEFKCDMTLPPNAEFQTIYGPLSKSSHLSKQLVCLVACKKLQQMGALSDHLLPHNEDPSENSRKEQVSGDLEGLTYKISQLKKQIQAERVLSVKEKVQKNRVKLSKDVSHLLSLSKQKTVDSSKENSEGGTMLSSRMKNPACILTGPGQIVGDDNSITQEAAIYLSAKLPPADRIPPYTTWIFLDRSNNKICSKGFDVCDKKTKATLDTIRSWTTRLAKRLNVCGLMNCQYAITRSGEVYLLEAKPQASRTVPFVSKAIGRPLAKYASLVMSGLSFQELGFTKEIIPKHISVKEAVLPFEKFQGCDVFLGPEMRSTGEVMGIDTKFSIAFAKSQIAAGQKLPVSGTVFLSLIDMTKPQLSKIARAFSAPGFTNVATSETANILELDGVPVERVLKLHEGRPHAGNMIANGQINLMVITSSNDDLDQIDGRQLRRMALSYKIPIITTISGALATTEAIRSLKTTKFKMFAIQDYFKDNEQNIGNKATAKISTEE